MEELTREEAMEALKQGKKVMHKYFVENDFIFWNAKESCLEDCDGIPMDWDDFWMYRKSEGFNTGWSIWIECY